MRAVVASVGFNAARKFHAGERTGKTEQVIAVYRALIARARLTYDLLVVFAHQALADNSQMLELLGFGAV